MRNLLILVSILIISSCKKEENINDIKNYKLVTEFFYINPSGKNLTDSIVELPLGGTIQEINSPHQNYIGAQFKNNSRRHHISGKLSPSNQNIFIQWKLRDLETNKTIFTKTDDEIYLHLTQGKYRLTQYVYENEEERKLSINSIDSISKILNVRDELTVDSIHIDLLSFNSPYLNIGLDFNKPVDAYVSIYNEKEDYNVGRQPMFNSETMKNLQKDTKGIKFNILPNNIIHSSRTQQNEKNKNFIQLNVLQDQKSYTLIDNHWGLVFNYLQSGFLSSDKTKLLEEQKLKFGSMTLTIFSSYTFMQ